MTLGEKLREARKQANLSQEQLAEQICVSRSAVAKWESDLGHPDIENLRELAQLFNLSMDVLTDDALSLEDAAARNSALTCCGKSCEGCTHRESLNCPGCRKMDHHGVDGCGIARCCQGKRLDSCNDCNYRETCNTLRGRDYIPAKRLTALNTHKAKEKALADRSAAYASWLAQAYPVLHQWMPLLFGVYLLPIAANLLGLIPIIAKPAALLSVVLSAGYALLLLKLSPMHPHYKKASFFCLAAAAVAVIATFCPDVDKAAAALQDAITNDRENLGQLMQDYDTAKLIDSAMDLIRSALLFGAAYFEYHAHADILAPFHKTLSQEWMKLWKAEWLITGGSLALLTVTLALPFLAALFVLVLIPLGLGSIGLLIYRYSLLFRLSKYFRTATAEEMLRSADTTIPLPS